jgi:hypothetical protein
VYLIDKDVGNGKSTKNPPIPRPATVNRWDFWSTGFGDFVQVDSDFNARGYKITTGGIDLGIDYRLTSHFAVGLMGSYAHTWTDLLPGNIDVDSALGNMSSSTQLFRSPPDSPKFPDHLPLSPAQPKATIALSSAQASQPNGAPPFRPTSATIGNSVETDMIQTALSVG